MPEQTESVIETWRIHTTQNTRHLEKYQSLLSDKENQRSQKIIHPEVRATYVTVHAVLRHLLGLQLNLDPQSVQIRSQPDKKPTIDHPGHIFFNISHSHSVSMIAISRQHEVGVDIETTHKQRDFSAIARRFFTAKEFSWLENMAPATRTDIFHQLWCHKEALLKGLGTGLQGGLEKICLAEHDFNNPFYYKNWSILTLSGSIHERAAIAVNTRKYNIIEHAWHADKEPDI